MFFFLLFSPQWKFFSFKCSACKLPLLENKLVSKSLLTGLSNFLESNNSNQKAEGGIIRNRTPNILSMWYFCLCSLIWLYDSC